MTRGETSGTTFAVRGTENVKCLHGYEGSFYKAGMCYQAKNIILELKKSEYENVTFYISNLISQSVSCVYILLSDVLPFATILMRYSSFTFTL